MREEDHLLAIYLISLPILSTESERHMMPSTRTGASTTGSPRAGTAFFELLTGATHGGATGTTHGGGSGAGTGAGPSNDNGAGTGAGPATATTQALEFLEVLARMLEAQAVLAMLAVARTLEMLEVLVATLESLVAITE